MTRLKVPKHLSELTRAFAMTLMSFSVSSQTLYWDFCYYRRLLTHLGQQDCRLATVATASKLGLCGYTPAGSWGHWARPTLMAFGPFGPSAFRVGLLETV